MSDMKCPFCGEDLQEFGGGDFPLLHYCDNINCNLYHIMGQYTLWQELIRTRKALELATDTLCWYDNNCDYVEARNTLDEIKTALEQKD